MSGPERVVTSRGSVVIATERCKGCELCIPACPPHVLEMSKENNAIGFAYPELSAGCTGCRACLMVCPDFCFEVYRYDEPVVHQVVHGVAHELEELEKPVVQGAVQEDSR